MDEFGEWREQGLTLSGGREKSGLFALTSGAQPHGRAYDRGQHGPFAVFGPTASEHLGILRGRFGDYCGKIVCVRVCVCVLGFLAHCLSRTRPSPLICFSYWLLVRFKEFSFWLKKV